MLNSGGEAPVAVQIDPDRVSGDDIVSDDMPGIRSRGPNPCAQARDSGAPVDPRDREAVDDNVVREYLECPVGGAHNRFRRG